MGDDAAELDRLVRSLTRRFPGASGREVASELGLYARAHDDWRTFALFDDEGYTRNQVAREEPFELLLLCWGPGQESPIHNHEGQDCWMAVLEGRIEEVRYPMPEPGARPGPLEPRESRVYGPGEVAFIRDEMGLHLVRSADPTRPAVSLHLYAEPYDACNVYCPETGRVTRTRLVNHSVRGRLVGSSR